MKLLDKNLIYLRNYLSKNTFSKRGAAEYLDITERHLTRLLRRWSDHGLITYFQGRGRGNRSIVQFNVDIEESVLNKYVKNLEKYSIEEIRDILASPISKETKQFIKAALENRLFSKVSTHKIPGERITVYYHSLSEIKNEMIRCEFSIMTLTLNVANRLYEINDKGNIINGLVRYDEWKGRILIIYLRKDIRFYNGQNMCAAMVIKNLERILQQKNMSRLQKYILSIDQIDAFKLSITMTHRFEIFKYILSRLDTSIFLWENGKPLTAGPYYIDDYGEKSIYLKQNPYYFGGRSDITHVEMTSDPNRYSQYIKQNALMNIPLHKNSIMTYVILNPSSCGFNLRERLTLRKLILQFLSIRGEVYNKALYSTHEQEVSLNFEYPLKIIVDDHIPETYQLVEYLNNCGIPSISIPIDGPSEEGDIYLGKVFTEKQFFFNMLVFEPFGDWFIDLDEGKKLIDKYKSNRIEEWENAETTFEKWIYEEGYYVPAIRTIRHVNLPAKFTNVKGNEYSIVKFNHFLVRGE